MSGTFSRVVLETLLAARVDVRALVVPGFRRSADLFRLVPRPRRRLHISSPTAVYVAWAHGLPVIEVGSTKGTEPPGLLRELRPVAFCVACFPWLLPRAWLDFTPLGGLNLHPSLLPAYRGPVPLFWQLRDGHASTGVTLHRLDEGADTGDIVAQSAVPFPDGLTRDALEARLAEAGARLLASALAAPPFQGRPQTEAGASQQGPPSAGDLEVPTTWAARRAFNFIRGAADWGPFVIVAEGGRILVREALSFRPEGDEPGSVRSVADGTEVGFSPRTVVVR